MPCSTGGPFDDAPHGLRERLAILHDAGGDVLVIALDGTPGRSRASGRTSEPGTERLTDDGWRRLGAVVDAITADAAAAGHAIAFHPHTGTFVETPAETARLLASLSDDRLGI